MNAKTLWTDIEAVRAQAPLVHSITNYVVMNNTANALLALGASPLMAHAEEEMDEMVAISSALVLNIGTLSKPWIAAMHHAQQAARAKGIPVILDPVGAGASRLRTDTAQHLLNAGPVTVLRGNASEILALQTAEAAAKGVDSQHAAESALDAARALAAQHQCVVCISGPTDFIVQGETIHKVLNGDPLMPRVTGLGCTATALIGAFCAVNPDPLAATTHAMAIMGIAGEIASEVATGPASLQVHFIDALHLIEERDVEQRIRIDT